MYYVYYDTLLLGADLKEFNTLPEALVFINKQLYNEPTLHAYDFTLLHGGELQIKCKERVCSVEIVS